MSLTSSITLNSVREKVARNIHDSNLMKRYVNDLAKADREKWQFVRGRQGYGEVARIIELSKKNANFRAKCGYFYEI